MHWFEILEKLRKEQSPVKEERPVLRLPLPPPYYEQDQVPDFKEEQDRGVVIIDFYQNTWENS